MKLPIPSTVRFVWRVRIDCYGSMSNVQKHSETVFMHDSGQLEKVTIPIIRNAETNGTFLGLCGKQLWRNLVEVTSGVSNALSRENQWRHLVEGLMW